MLRRRVGILPARLAVAMGNEVTLNPFGTKRAISMHTLPALLLVSVVAPTIGLVAASTILSLRVLRHYRIIFGLLAFIALSDYWLPYVAAFVSVLTDL